MKSCMQCGAEASDEVATCAECGREFAYVATSASDGLRAAVSLRERPDGRGLKTFGVILFSLALFAFLLGWFLPASEYSFQDIDPARIALKGNLMLFGGSSLQVGTMVGLTGAIIEAISFLPSKDD